MTDKAIVTDEVERLRGALSAAWVRMRNARGAVESNQVVDKDVRGTLTRGIEEIDAALSIPAQEKAEGEVEPDEVEAVAGAIWYDGYGQYRSNECKWPDDVRGGSQELFRSMARAAIRVIAPPSAKRGEVEVKALDEDFVERLAVAVHSLDADDDTVKWSKQPGKYRASIRRDVRDVINAILSTHHAIVPRSTLHSSSVEKVEGVETPAPVQHLRVTFVAECLRNYAEILRSGQIDNAGHYLPEDIEEAAEQMEESR